jgi:long-chain fatty acid transport protein
MKRSVVGGVAASLLLLVPPSHAAWAAAFALKEQGAIDQGTSYAGATARADDPTTLFYNPAGITQLAGYQVSVNASYIAPLGDAYRQSASYSALLGGGAVAGTTDGNIAPAAFLPSIFATAAVTPDLHLGLAVTSPFGLSTKYDDTSLSRYYALATSLRNFDIAPTIAYRLAPALSVSATLIIETADGYDTNAVDFGGAGALTGLGSLGLLPGSADGTASFRGSDVAVGFQLAALYQPRPGTNLGISFRSAIDHRLGGSLDFHGVPAVLAAGFASQPAYSKLVTPADISAGIAQALGRWRLLADVQWTQWSRFRNLTAVLADGTSFTSLEDWHDTWTVAAGAEYRLNQALTLRAGTAYDQTPTYDATRTPRIPDSSRVWLSGGLTWRVTPSMAISGAYSHLFGSDTLVMLTDAGPGTANFLRGNLTTAYHTAVDIVSLQATLAF